MGVYIYRGFNYLLRAFYSLRTHDTLDYLPTFEIYFIYHDDQHDDAYDVAPDEKLHSAPVVSVHHNEKARKKEGYRWREVGVCVYVCR